MGTRRREERPVLRLSDAMAEALRERAEDEAGGAAMRGVQVTSRLLCGIRLERCGGGRRVIRRQGRRD